MAMSLAFPVAPLPGESILNVLQRAAAENCYLSVGEVLSLVEGFDGPFHLAESRMNGLEANLAEVLGHPERVEDIAAMTIRRTPGQSGWLTFAGTSLRRIHRDLRHRRVAPRSLRRALHDKAVWSIKAFSFDPITKESLLGECPSCTRPFSYGRTRGLQFCDNCSRVDDWGFVRGCVDLRDHPQPIVQCEDEEALDFVTALVDPDPDNPGRKVPVPQGSPFVAVERGHIFELVITIANALVAEVVSVGHGVRRLRTRESFAQIKAHHLEAAGRAVLSWPDGFFRLVEANHNARSDTRTLYGMQHETGTLFHMKRNRNLDDHVQGIVQDALVEYMSMTAPTSSSVRRRGAFRDDSRLMTLGEAALRYSIRPRTLKMQIEALGIERVTPEKARSAPKLISSAVMERIAAETKVSMPEAAVRRRWGVPREGLCSLAATGHLRPTSRLERWESSYAVYYDIAAVEEFEKSLEAVLVPLANGTEGVTVNRALFLSGLTSRSALGDVVGGILDRTVAASRSDGEGRRFGAIVLHDASVVEAYVDPRNENEDQRIFAIDAAEMLAVDPKALRSYVALGLMKPAITLRTAKKFSSRYMTLAETRKIMQAQLGPGVEWAGQPTASRSNYPDPILDLGGSTALWLRKEVEAWVSSELQDRQ